MSGSEMNGSRVDLATEDGNLREYSCAEGAVSWTAEMQRQACGSYVTFEKYSMGQSLQVALAVMETAPLEVREQMRLVNKLRAALAEELTSVVSPRKGDLTHHDHCRICVESLIGRVGGAREAYRHQTCEKRGILGQL